MSKALKDFEELFLVFKKNVYPAMVELLAEDLGVTVESINKLDVGFYPGEQAWVTAERDATGHIIGLNKRYQDGKKCMEPGSKRGLIYDCIGRIDKKSNNQRRYKFVRAYNVGVSCPLCGKNKWCLVSDDNPSDPSAVICGHTPKGAIRYIENSGYLHHLRPVSSQTKCSDVLPHSDKPIIVVEGASDVLAAMDMGFVAVGKPAAESGHKELADLLRGKNVVVVGENDEAGIRGMKKSFNVLRAVCKSVQKVLPPTKYKDLRAWHPMAEVFEKHLEKQGEEAEDNKVLDSVNYDDLAEQWLNELNNIFRWYQNEWFLYGEVHYQQTNKNWLSKQLREYFRQFEIRIQTGPVKAVVPLRVDKKLVEELQLALQSICYVGEKMDTKLKNAVVFQNGIYHITENKLAPLTPDTFITFMPPCRYDLRAECPLWLWFITDIFNGDEESIKLLQEWFGYNLVANNDMEQLLFLFGVPGSGKSTTIDVLRAMLGPERCCAINVETFAGQFGLAPLVDKYAAIISEQQSTDHRQAQKVLEKIKQITGQDTVGINRKYKEQFDTKLFCRFTYVGNDLPRFDDEPQALFRRFNLLYFGNSYVNKPNRTLKTRLIQEVPGVTNWALEGLRRLLEQGDFTRPELSIEHINTCKAMASPLKTMLDEWCDLSNSSIDTPCNTLYDLHRVVYEEEGRRPLTRTQFGVKFKNARPDINRQRKMIAGMRTYVYEGLQILPEAYERYLK